MANKNRSKKSRAKNQSKKSRANKIAVKKSLITCVCGSIITESARYGHYRTMKHVIFVSIASKNSKYRFVNPDTANKPKVKPVSSTANKPKIKPVSPTTVMLNYDGNITKGIHFIVNKPIAAPISPTTVMFNYNCNINNEIQCDCGSIIKSISISSHIRCKKHISYVRNMMHHRKCNNIIDKHISDSVLEIDSNINNDEPTVELDIDVDNNDESISNQFDFGMEPSSDISNDESVSSQFDFGMELSSDINNDESIFSQFDFAENESIFSPASLSTEFNIYTDDEYILDY